MDKNKNFGAGPEWFFLAALLAPSAMQSSRPLGKKIARALVDLGELLEQAIEEQEVREAAEFQAEFDFVEGPEAQPAPSPVKPATAPAKETVIKSAPEPAPEPTPVPAPVVMTAPPAAPAPDPAPPIIEVAQAESVAMDPMPAPEPPVIETAEVEAVAPAPQPTPAPPVIETAKIEAVAPAPQPAPAPTVVETSKVEAVTPEPTIGIATAESTAPHVEATEEAGIRWKSDMGSSPAPAASSTPEPTDEEEFIEEVILPTPSAGKPIPAPVVAPAPIPSVTVPAALKPSDAPKQGRTLADILQQSATRTQEQPLAAPLSPSPIPAQVPAAATTPPPIPTPVPTPEPIAEPVATAVPPVMPVPVPHLTVTGPTRSETAEESATPAPPSDEWDFATERNRVRAEMGASLTTDEPETEVQEAEEDAVGERRGFAFFPESEESEEGGVESARPARQITKIGFRSRLEAKSRRPAPKPKMAGPRPHLSVSPSGVPSTAPAPEPVAAQPAPPVERRVERNRFTVPEDLEVG